MSQSAPCFKGNFECMPSTMAVCYENITVTDSSHFAGLGLLPLPIPTGDHPVREMLYCTICLAVFWELVFMAARRWLWNVMEGKPWADKAIQRQIASAEKMLQLEDRFSKKTGLELYETNFCVIIQHTAGAVLCIPAVVGLGTASMGFALARFGAVSEVAWEVLDTSERIYAYFFTCEGKELNTLSLAIVLALHHATAMGMVLPMNIYYPENYYYALMVFALQGAGTVGTMTTQYLFTLDTTKPLDLLQVRLLSIICVVLLTLQRAVLFCLCSYKLLTQFYSTGATNFFCGGLFACSCMGFFNVLILHDSFCRMIKFMKLSPESSPAAGAKDVVQNVGSHVGELVSPHGAATRSRRISHFSAIATDSSAAAAHDHGKTLLQWLFVRDVKKEESMKSSGRSRSTMTASPSHHGHTDDPGSDSDSGLGSVTSSSEEEGEEEPASPYAAHTTSIGAWANAGLPDPVQLQRRRSETYLLSPKLQRHEKSAGTARAAEAVPIPPLPKSYLKCRSNTHTPNPTVSLSPDLFKPMPACFGFPFGKSALCQAVPMTGLVGACGAVTTRSLREICCMLLRMSFESLIEVSGLQPLRWKFRLMHAQDLQLEPPQFLVDSLDIDTCAVPGGGVLRAKLFLPRQAAGPFPVVILRTPYGRSKEMGQTLLAERGFAVLVQDTRGRFSSDGDFVPVQNERDDGSATIAWVTKQHWCNGRIGVLGASYLGFTAWASLGAAGPKIDAAFIINSQSQVKRAVLQKNGAISFELCLLWLYLVVHLLGGSGAAEFLWKLGKGIWNQTLQKGILHLPICELDELCLGRALPLWQAGVQSFRNPRGDFWENKDLLCDVNQWGPRLQLLSGWHDVFLEQNLEDFQKAGQRASLTVLPCSHWGLFGYQHLMSKIKIELFQEQLQDKLVKDPACQVARVQLGVFDSDAIIGFEDWPPPSTAKSFYLADGGALQSCAAAKEWERSYTYDPADPTPASGGPSFNIANAGEKDQAPIERRSDVLTFTSEPLEEAMLITGKVVVDLEIEVGSVSADFVARLCAVNPHGISMNRCEGLTTVTGPGRRRVHVDLGSTCALFRQGYSIRLHVLILAGCETCRQESLQPLLSVWCLPNTRLCQVQHWCCRHCLRG